MKGYAVKHLAISALMLAALAAPASADVAISKAATRDMSCSAGVCTPTARRAVLNATDLATMLASGDVTVETGSGAKSIAVTSTFSWASASRLTLQAQKSVNVGAPIVVAGPGALTVTTGAGGDLAFFSRGRADFWDNSSSLIVNGTTYMLVGDISSLAAAVTADPAGSYALGGNYNASADGTYFIKAVPWLDGNFDGLGHTIDKLSIDVERMHVNGGMFEGSSGTIRDIHLQHLKLTQTGQGQFTKVGGLAGENDGLIARSSVGGALLGGRKAVIGGLAGFNTGPISLCSASVSMTGGFVGGLVGIGTGTISQSWATGSLSAISDAGGLIADGYGETAKILQSYSTASVEMTTISVGYGGLAGFFGNQDHASIAQSYSTGAVSGPSQGGGFIGFDNTISGMSSDYWDLDTSGVSDPSRGAANVANDPGITGLSDTALKSDLPAGFDPKVWAQSASVNNGYPYLIANPPQ